EPTSASLSGSQRLGLSPKRTSDMLDERSTTSITGGITLSHSTARSLQPSGIGAAGFPPSQSSPLPAPLPPELPAPEFPSPPPPSRPPVPPALPLEIGRAH